MAGSKMWADSRATGKKYQYCRQGKGCQKPDAAPAKTGKRLAARFYQLKTSHRPTGQYLKWTKNRPSAKCWWCPYQSQTREHLFKCCPRWKRQQRLQWAEVRRQTAEVMTGFRIRDLFADERRSQAILDSSPPLGTDVGRLAPKPAEEDPQSEASEWELRARNEREEE
jgi:hypothetical protein